jgi:2-hydroxychromene-2-carboxylate isomerase
VLFAALLQHHGTKGPAEVEAKRAWTFRHVHWLAQHHGVALQTPLRHPFNPMSHLRLLLACAPPGGRPNRHAVQQVLAQVWQGGGADANDTEALAALQARLAPERSPQGEDVKAELKAQSERAIALGLFGVPSVVLEGRSFWGLDSLPMVRDALAGHAWFDGPAWAHEGAPREGVRRG